MLTKMTPTETTQTFQQWIDDASRSGGGQVVIPPGRHVCGSLQLRSNIELHLSAGATIRAAIDQPELFGAVGKHDASRTANSDFGAMIQAHDCRDVSITGPGTLDGAGDPETCPDWKTAQGLFRPAVAYFHICHRLRIESTRIINARWWTLHLLRCEDVNLHGIHISNTWPNSDGIDPDGCKRVIISGCNLLCGDDCIVAKSTQGDDCEDMTITNCILHSPRWACFKLGTESLGSFRNVSLSNCVMRGGVAFALYLKDGGSMENIIASQMNIESDADYPILIDAMRRDYQRDKAAGMIRNVSINDCMIRSAGRAWIEGEVDAPLENISLRNLAWHIPDPLPTQRNGKPLGSARVKPAPDRPCYEQSDDQLIVVHAGVRTENIQLSGDGASARQLNV